jgi:hypothetical protein
LAAGSPALGTFAALNPRLVVRTIHTWMVASDSPRPLRERLPLLAAWVAAGVAALFLLLASTQFVKSSGYAFDFNCYWGGAQRLAAGTGIYLPQNLEGPFQHGAPAVYVYAPPLAVLMAPATALPFDVAAFGWLVLHLVALVAACALMPVGRPIRLAAFAVAAFSSPLLVDLNLGNVSTFVLLVSVIGWRWLDRPAAAVALAAGMALRPQLGVVLVWWLVRRRFRLVAWAVLAGAALVIATLPFVGVQGYADFLRVVRNDQVAGVIHNGSLESAAIFLGFSGPVPTLAFVLGAAVAVGAILVSLRRDTEISYAVTLCASLLLTPLLWGHYLLVLLIPAALLAQRGRVWALALPLLGWLPDGAISIAAFAGLLLPLVIPTRPPVSAPSGVPFPTSAPAPAVR